MTTPTDVVIPDDASTAEFPSVPLILADRCDRCGAQAFVRATLLTGELLFCKHHFEANEAKLRPVSISIQDEREKINATSASSA